MSVHYTFKWPKGPEEVIVTGTFDKWSKTLPLVKQADGSFALQVPLPPQKETILYKYVVDGAWQINPEEKIAKDSQDIENNVLEEEDLVQLLTIPGSLIPESGLQYTSAKAGNNGSQKGEEKGEKSQDLKTTVLPKEEPHHATIAGEPGIQIPQDKEALSAFETFETTDAKALNENVTEIGTANSSAPAPASAPASAATAAATTQPSSATTSGLDDANTTPTTGVLAENSELSPEEREKQKKKVKRTKYKAKKKAKAAEANGLATSNTADEEDESEEYSPEPVPVVAAAAEGSKVTEEELKKESDANTEINEDVREQFERPSEEVETPTDKEKEEKSDFTAANVLKATAIGGAGAGAGVAGAELGQTIESKDAEVPLSEPAANVAVPLSEPAADVAVSKEIPQPAADVAVSKEIPQPAVEESVVAVPATTEGNHVKTLDPKAGSSATSPDSTTLASKPLAEPVAGTSNNAESNEGKEVNAFPVAKVTEPELVQEEEIIIAKGDKKDISAAVEATEGGPVILEEIKPTKSEQDELTKEVRLASQVEGPVTIEQVNVPKEEIANLQNSAAEPTRAKEATTAAAAAAQPATKSTTKPTTTTTTTNKTKPKETEKKGFRGFLKKIFS
ncbi:CRP1 [Candida oxycetoniae]|uniref:CRP1 n=1 Tax=Candida oxycetoniae TaxID=497107 RepID=A0AAI9SV32_9ASCO|nr:CRP1 [Candida oxycetoniae]KAI3403230.2 CRP1 [Candida oxycetoniae]